MTPQQRLPSLPISSSQHWQLHMTTVRMASSRKHKEKNAELKVSTNRVIHVILEKVVPVVHRTQLNHAAHAWSHPLPTAALLLKIAQ